MELIKRWQHARELHSQLPLWQQQLEERLIPDSEVQTVVSENLRLTESLINLIQRKEYA